MDFDYRIDDQDGIQIVQLSGKLLGREQTQALTDAVDDLVASGKNHLIINLEQLTHMNSTGLGILIHFLTKSRNSGGELVVVKVPPVIQKLLIITKLNNVFSQENDMDAAIATLKDHMGEATA